MSYKSDLHKNVLSQSQNWSPFSVGSSDPKPGITRGLDPIFGFFQFKALGIFSISGRVGFRPDFFFQLFSGQGLESSQIKFQLQLGLFQGLKKQLFSSQLKEKLKKPEANKIHFFTKSPVTC